MTRPDTGSIPEDVLYPSLRALTIPPGHRRNPQEHVPDLLKMAIAVASEMAEHDMSRLAMLFPRLCDIPFWIAVFSTLERMRRRFVERRYSFPPLRPGEKVLVDGKTVAIYCEETEGKHRIKFYRRSGDPDWVRIPGEERMRLQAASTDQDLSTLNSYHQNWKKTDFCDTLLDIRACWNREIFPNEVILVSRLGRARSLMKSTLLLPPPDDLQEPQSSQIEDLLLWGVLDIDGQIKERSNSRMKASPTLLLASDLIAVRKYLVHSSEGVPTGHAPLIILDGGGTFTRRSGELDAVLEAGCPVLACIENHESDHIESLAEKDFRIWQWTREDLRLLIDKNDELPAGEARAPQKQGKSLFGDLYRSCLNYACGRVTRMQCEDERLQSVVSRFQEVRREARDTSGSNELMDQIHGCLMMVARALYPVSENSEHVRSRIASLQQEIDQNRQYLPEQIDMVARELIELLKALVEEGQECANAKATVLRELLPKLSGQSVGIVVSNRKDLEPCRQYWEPFIREHRLDVRFYPENDPELTGCEHLILPGWLGQNRMRPLLQGAIAPEITLLLYPFEERWYRGASRKWNRRPPSPVTPREKKRVLSRGASLLHWPGLDLPDAVEPEPEPPADVEEAPEDPDEFEVSLRRYRYEQRVRAAQIDREEQVQATCLSFSAGYYAFLTEERTVPVVTDILLEVKSDGKIPRRKSSELKIGDYVVFREGARSDVLREWADRGLQKIGKGHLREVASLWRKALLDFMRISPEARVISLDRERFASLLDRLRRAGVQTGEQTVRWWLIDDSTIGPKLLEYLKGIAVATESSELHARLDEVREAIEQVRGAHLQAARYLARRILSTLQDHLSAIDADTSPILDFGEDGKIVIVRVEAIEDEPVPVSWTRVNRLLRDED
ncbi:MAG: DrmE family protein [Chloroherpetonaceae bacterium]|nr:DrmE family protein [Chloroherpetonaceae bacterium]